VLLWRARIPHRTGFHNAAGAWLYTRRVRYRSELHEVERNLALVGGGAWERPRMFPSEQERARAAALLERTRALVAQYGQGVT